MSEYEFQIWDGKSFHDFVWGLKPSTKDCVETHEATQDFFYIEGVKYPNTVYSPIVFVNKLWPH